jgi:hypothetical protein
MPPAKTKTLLGDLGPTRKVERTRLIRAAIDRLLRGQIPATGKCDVKPLAREAGIDRTAFYGDRPYAHLREESETRLAALATIGELPDPRVAQIARLKTQVATLTERLAHRDQTITEHATFRAAALSRLAAQHEEINRLRVTLTRPPPSASSPLTFQGPGHATSHRARHENDRPCRRRSR